MRKSLFLLSSLVGVAWGSVTYEVLNIEATATVRAYQLNNETNRVWLTGHAIDADTGANSASVDAVAFGMQNADFGDGVGFYFGTLQADGTYTVGSSSISASVSGSLSEVAVNFLGLAPYENNDGEAGFQYLPGEDHFNCFEEDVDCLVDFGSSYVSFESLGWNPIQITQSNCEQEGNPNCVVYKFTSSTTGTTGVTAQFNMYVASQPIELDGGASVTPDSFKIDVSWTTPSSFYPANCQASCATTLIALAGGKAFTASAEGVLDVTGDTATGSSTFKAEQGKVAYFAWDSEAVVDGASSTIYSNVITGQNVSDLADSCSDAAYFLNHGTACLTNAGWLITYNLYKAFGWELRLYFFSVAEVGTGNVVWDPQLGGADCEADPEAEFCSSSSDLLPLLLLSSLFL